MANQVESIKERWVVQVPLPGWTDMFDLATCTTIQGVCEVVRAYLKEKSGKSIRLQIVSVILENPEKNPELPLTPVSSK